ncbi:DUF4349 domain-containing protein [Dyella sp. 2RAB6]|uniref:DUF4349 domain-containing protein n=1 Tax=Dyella sp. 2RAB6 TaxID=3232992 RepID=UPI003F8FE6A3
MPRLASIRTIVLALLLVPLLAACSKKQEVTPQAGIGGEKNKAGALLAYEHRLTLRLPADTIAPRLNEARAACESARFGECNVLRIEQSSWDASITVRIVPGGVEPLVALAAKGGEVGERETSAEDLAPAVADNQRNQQRLQAQQKRLDELAARKDLAVADLIALGKEQAAVESELQALEQTAAGQQHRIATNLLTMKLRRADADTRGSRLRESFSGVFDQFVDGLANAVEAISYGLPFVLLGFPLLLLWLWLWRRFGRRKA